MWESVSKVVRCQLLSLTAPFLSLLLFIPPIPSKRPELKGLPSTLPCHLVPSLPVATDSCSSPGLVQGVPAYTSFPPVHKLLSSHPRWLTLGLEHSRAGIFLGCLGRSCFTHIYDRKEFWGVIEDLSFGFGFWLFPHCCLSSSGPSCTCNHSHELGASIYQGPPL